MEVTKPCWFSTKNQNRQRENRIKLNRTEEPEDLHWLEETIISRSIFMSLSFCLCLALSSIFFKIQYIHTVRVYTHTVVKIFLDTQTCTHTSKRKKHLKPVQLCTCPKKMACICNTRSRARTHTHRAMRSHPHNKHLPTHRLQREQGRKLKIEFVRD